MTDRKTAQAVEQSEGRPGGWTVAPGMGRAYLLFVEDLHGKVVPGLLVLHQHHPPKGACAEGLDSFKLIQMGCILWEEGLRGSGTLSEWGQGQGPGPPLPPAEGALGSRWSDGGGGRTGGGKTRWRRTHSLRRVAGARSGPGPGPRNCWQLHGGQGPPGGRGWWGGGA